MCTSVNSMASSIWAYHLPTAIALCTILAVVSSHPEKWSMSESDSDFEPSFSVLEQWSELPLTYVGMLERQDSLRAATPDREDKIMKQQPDRIINRPPSQNKTPDVSETDLFLLGAIEKLAYRIDYLEKRTRRLEDIVYQVVAGPPAMDADPCPQEFFRQNGVCYHISKKQVNWKSASSMCRSLGGILLELHNEKDRHQFTSFLHNDPQTKGSDYWTGGLNPGLLWLWGTSAKPVTSNTTNSGTEIHGTGRCLLLAFHPPTRSYQYKGADCAIRHRYVCQLEDNTTERRLQRYLRPNIAPSGIATSASWKTTLPAVS